MARKDLLKGLMGGNEPVETPEGEAPSPAPRHRYSRGAIGAVSQSIAELKSRALVEVVADQIDSAGLQDRLDADPEGHEALKASIRDYGQQVPVLLRFDPNVEGRYQIVYGRRRVAALKDLGLPVKAMVREVNDRELVIAQGQENAARKDLSFIEKANFARQMREAGFERKVICDALHIDKTVISRMLTVADAIPASVIRAIGAAPSVGRDRWLGLVSAIEVTGLSEKALLERIATFPEEGSDARFERLSASLTDRPAPAAKSRPTGTTEPIDGAKGPIGQVSRPRGRVRLDLKDQAFAEWLVENMSEIHRDWANRSGE